MRPPFPSAIKSGRDHGANDCTIFRKKPLVRESRGLLSADVTFVLEKFQAGPYWRVSDTGFQTGDKLRRFWGAVFELYVNEQMQWASQHSTGHFVPDPRWADDPLQQVCDGVLVEGDALVLLEYKANMFTSGAKYSGNHVVLRDEIVTKLVRNEGTGKKKGVEQLAHAAHRILDGASVLGVDTIRSRLYPLLVTLDDIGGTLLMSRFLARYFYSYLAKMAGSSSTHSKLRPLFCTDIGSLEDVPGFLDVRPLSDFLQFWIDSDAALNSTLLAHPPVGLPNRHNEILYQSWLHFSQQIEARLFPREHAARGRT